MNHLEWLKKNAFLELSSRHTELKSKGGTQLTQVVQGFLENIKILENYKYTGQRGELLKGSEKSQKEEENQDSKKLAN